MRREPDFDASADMRLLELQRAALGVAPLPRANWESRIAAEGSAVEAEIEPELSGAVLAVEASATPPGGVIVGAVVTLALSIANEGATPATRVRVNVPLPGGAAYRPGSFVRDGRAQRDDDAEEFFGPGTQIAALAPRTRSTFIWKIGVRPGNTPLIIAPTVTAADSAVIGARPLSVSRKEGSAHAGFAAEITARIDPALYDPTMKTLEELPIYELDEEEQLQYEAADSALQTRYEPSHAPVPPQIVPPAQPEPPQPEEPAVPFPQEPPAEPDLPEEPPFEEPQAALAPVSTRQGVVLIGQIDRPTLAYFERIFRASKPPTLLNHFIFAGAVACTRNYDGNDGASLKKHQDAQAQILQRITLHEKLGRKEPITEYAGELLAQLQTLRSSPVLAAPGLSSSAKALVLEADITGPIVGVLHKMYEERDRWDFVKARQLTLALQGQRVIANASPAAVERVEDALRVYAQSAMTQLQRFFVRIRIDRTTGLLSQTDATLDMAANTVLNALGALFAEFNAA